MRARPPLPGRAPRYVHSHGRAVKVRYHRHEEPGSGAIGQMKGVGVDFGTTNSVLAVCGADQQPQFARFQFSSGETDVFRSVIFFEEVSGPGSSRVSVTGGPDALNRYLEVGGEGRLLQSLKAYLASRELYKIAIFNRSYDLEALIGYLLRRLREQSEAQFGPLPRRVVVGRPVRFAHAHAPEDDLRAETRLRQAFRLAGFGDITFELEPVAAARSYENSLDHDEVVLVGDFGGGTSDFCILNLGPSFCGHDRAERVLGVAGIGLAGDALDACIVEHLIAPALGRGTRFKTETDKWVPVPNWIYTKLSHWHDTISLSFPKNLALLQNIQRNSDRPETITALIYLLEHELGFALTTKVQEAKAEVSRSLTTDLALHHGSLVLSEILIRNDFERWIGREVEAIENCLDKLFEHSGVQRGRIDRVFLTGGTSRVPRIAQIFEERFPGRVVGGGGLTSIAGGLALIANEMAA